jgi:hypothetical protein
MQALKPVLKFFALDIRDSYLIFWGVLIAVTALSFLFALTVTDGHFGMSGNFAVYIYMSITGFLIVKYTLPYLLGLSTTRYHYYWGLILGSIGLAVLQALSLLVYVGVFSNLAEWLGIAENFNIFSFKTDAFFNNEWLSMFIIDLAFCLAAISWFGLIGSIHYRFGLLPLLVVGLLGILILMTPSFRSLFQPVLEWVTADTLPRLLLLALGQIIFSFFCMWLVLRRATIVPGGKR